MTRLRLLHYTIKNNLKMTPIAILGILIPVIIIGVLFYYVSGSLMADKTEKPLATVGLVMEEAIDNTWYDTAFSYLSNMESTADSIVFNEYEDMESATKDLNNGTILAIIYLPEGIVDSILYGENMPATITFSPNVNISSIYFAEVTAAGAEYLSAAQAASYTCGELFYDADMDDYVWDAYNAVDLINFSYVLARESLYMTTSTSLTDNINQGTFYAASGLMLILLFIGVSYNKCLKREESAFESLVKSNRISSFYICVCKFISMTIVLTLLITLIAIGCSFVKNDSFNEIINIRLDINTLLGLLVIAAFLAAYNVMIFSITRKVSGPILTLFILGVVMSIISGAIIPRVLLPASIESAGHILPTYQIHHILTSILQGNTVNTTHVISLLIHVVVCILVTFVITTIQTRRNSR